MCVCGRGGGGGVHLGRGCGLSALFSCKHVCTHHVTSSVEKWAYQFCIMFSSVPVYVCVLHVHYVHVIPTPLLVSILTLTYVPSPPSPHCDTHVVGQSGRHMSEGSM